MVAEARRHVRDGQLTVAERLLGDAGYDGNEAAALRREAAVRRAGIEPALAQAQAAFDRQDWDAAIRCVLEARGLHAANPQVADLSARIVQAVLCEIRSSIDAGRVDRADLLVARLLPLAGRTVDLEELDRIVGQCRRAVAQVAQGRPWQAEQVLRRLAVVLPKAGWLEDAIAAARQAGDALERLRTGPLGLMMHTPGLPERELPPAQDDVSEAATRILPAGTPAQPAGQAVPQRFLLHVDGVGSYLVVRKGQLTIGPAGRAGDCDIALLSDSTPSGVTIERADGDYFLKAQQAVLVNDRPVTERLLADGDRVALSNRCRMRFALPNAASASAVLHLSGTRLPGTDARRVILMDREVVIGPGAASHVRADGLEDRVVLYVRDGGLCCRAKDPVTVNEAALDGAAGLPLGATLRIGPLSMVITAVASDK